MTGPSADTIHCTFCFDALVAHLSGGTLPLPEFEDALWYVPSASVQHHVNCMQGFA